MISSVPIGRAILLVSLLSAIAGYSQACSLIGNETFRPITGAFASRVPFDAPSVQVAALDIPVFANPEDCGYMGLIKLSIRADDGAAYPDTVGVIVEYVDGNIPERLKLNLGERVRGYRNDSGTIFILYWWDLSPADLKPLDFMLRVRVLNASDIPGAPTDLRVTSPSVK
jgi:hypothetical protein